MNMKWFKTCALPAVLAAVVPIAAQAADYSFDSAITQSSPGTDQVIGARLSFGDTNVNWWSGTNTTSVNPDGSVSQIGNTYTFDTDATIDLVGGNSTTAGIVTGDYDGTFNLQNVNITGNGTGYFVGMQMLGGDVTTDPNVATFTGTINGKSIEVTNNDDSVEAYGVRFTYDNGTDPGDGIQGINGKVHFDSIKVTSGLGGTAFNAGAIGNNAEITLDNVESYGGTWAVGVHLNAPTTDANESALKVGRLIVATTNGGASGLNVSGSFTNTNPMDSSTKIELGAVDVTGTGDVIAVNGEKISNVTLNGPVHVTGKNAYAMKGTEVTGSTIANNITATADSSGESVGVLATGGVIQATIKDAVVINAGNGFETENGDMTIAYADENSSLKSNFSSNGNFTFDGKGGTLELQENNYVTGDSTFKDVKTVVSKAAAQSSTFAGNNTLEGTAEMILDVQNKEDRGDFNAALQNWGSWDSASLSKFVLGDGFTELAFDARGNLTLVQAESVNINDGFLAAYTIHNRYTTWNAVRDHMISGNGNRGGILGQECDPCADVVDCDPCDPRFNGFAGSIARNAWVNYIARSDEYRSSYQSRDWNLSTEGVQVGTDLYRTKHNQLGMLFGYEGGRMRNLGDLIKSEDIYVGVYGAHVFRNGWDVRGSFSYGWQDYDMTRSANTSSFKGRTSESTIEIGKRLGAGAWSLRPVFAVDVYNNNLKSAQETGANALTYADDSLTQVYLRSGTDLRYQARRFALNSGVYYSYDLHNQALSAAVSNVNFGSSTMVGSKLGRELLTFNLGADIAVAKNFSIFGGYQGQSLLDSDNDAFQSVGYIGANWKW